MCFSMAFLSVTGTSKVTITGMPTPTVSPSSGAIAANVCWSRLRSTVRNVVEVRRVVPVGLSVTAFAV